MTAVYLCYSGEYEDVRVDHIASSRNLATAWIDRDCGCGKIHGEESPQVWDYPEYAAVRDAMDEARSAHFGAPGVREAYSQAIFAWSEASAKWHAEVTGPWFATHCVACWVERVEVDDE
jgi:hypothetical protein